MHCSQKISKRNSLPFCRCRCLNVAYGCISVPLQLHFQLQKRQVVGQTQIKRVWGWLSIWHEQCAVPIVLLSTHAAQIMHTVFLFSNHQIECGEWWFLVSCTLHYHPTISTVVILQNSCHPSDASSIDFSSAANRLSLKYYSMQHGRVTKHSYKHLPHFCRHKSHFTTKFYRGTLFKIFFHGNL